MEFRSRFAGRTDGDFGGRKCRLSSETGHQLEVEAKLFSKDIREKRDQTQNVGSNCKTPTLADHLSLRKKGWFHIEGYGRQPVLTIHRPGEPDQTFVCRSSGHANQLRQALTDQGLAGLVEGAL